MKNKSASLLVVLLGKALSGIPHLSVVDKWPATPKRARTAPRRFLVIGGYYANNERMLLTSLFCCRDNHREASYPRTQQRD